MTVTVPAVATVAAAASAAVVEALAEAVVVAVAGSGNVAVGAAALIAHQPVQLRQEQVLAQVLPVADLILTCCLD